MKDELRNRNSHFFTKTLTPEISNLNNASYFSLKKMIDFSYFGIFCSSSENSKFQWTAFASYQVSDFFMYITIQAGTRKTAINSLKTIKKNIDESLKYFCGGSWVSDLGYPKRFFSTETRQYLLDCLNELHHISEIITALYRV